MGAPIGVESGRRSGGSGGADCGVEREPKWPVSGDACPVSGEARPASSAAYQCALDAVKAVSVKRGAAKAKDWQAASAPMARPEHAQRSGWFWGAVRAR